MVSKELEDHENSKCVLNRYRISFWDNQNILELHRDGWCSVSFVMREKQIRNSKIHPSNSPNPEPWYHWMLLKAWSNRNSGSWLVGIQSGLATLEVVWRYLPHYFPTLQFFCSSVFVQRCKNLTFTQKIRIQLFIAALFIIAQGWEPPRCPSVDERISNSPFRQRNIM